MTQQFAREKAQRIVEGVALEHGLAVADVCGDSREAPIVVARAQAIRRVERETQLTLAQIGSLFGGLDHSSVIFHLRGRRQQRSPDGATENHGRG